MLAKMIAGFLMLIPVLMLILTPLAMGIGFFNGLLAVWGMVSAFNYAINHRTSGNEWNGFISSCSYRGINRYRRANVSELGHHFKMAADCLGSRQNILCRLGRSPLWAPGILLKPGWLGYGTGILNILKGVGLFLLNFTPFGILLKTIIKNFGAIKKFISITLQMIKALWKDRLECHFCLFIAYHCKNKKRYYDWI